MDDTLIILNPVAGGGGGADRIEEWRTRRPNIEVRATDGEGDARRWAREAAEEGRRRVVAAGGDGTIHEVASGLLAGGKDTTLALLPLGTGNDLARSLQIPDDLEDALELLDRGRARPMDVARITLDGEEESYLVNALTGGFSGELHETLDAEVKEAWGPLSYLKSGLESWGERTTYPISVEVDGEEEEHEALNLVVANGGYAGGGLLLCPAADPFDGILDVAVVLDAPGWKLSALAARLLAGDDPDHEALIRRRGAHIQVRSDEPFPLSLDGEPAKASTFTLELEPGRISVVVGQ